MKLVIKAQGKREWCATRLGYHMDEIKVKIGVEDKNKLAPCKERSVTQYAIDPSILDPLHFLFHFLVLFS